MKKFYQHLMAVSMLLFIANAAFSQQNYFSKISENSISLPANAKRVIIPQKFSPFEMNVNALKDFLWQLPSENGLNALRSNAQVFALPMPDGSMQNFRVWESSVMEAPLQAKFPEMRTFAGQGIDDPYATVRMDFNPYFGFHAQILSPKGVVYVDPYARGSIGYYISYYKQDNFRDAPFKCETEDNRLNLPNAPTAGPCRGTQMFTYRLALACTGEYAIAVCSPNPPTVPATAAAMLTTVNRVTGVYEQEVTLRMVLIANNDLLIYLDPNTDPYTNNNGSTMLNQNQSNIDGIIGSANYDIGHVVSTGGGGIAQLRAPCTASKARGVTGLPNPVGDNFDIDYVAHEMGHQWGGNHTFNSTTSSCGGGNRNASTAYEVGSGTTIQAYAGICGTDNIQPHSDPFFHAVSFDEISSYIETGNGNLCKVATATGNTLPVINSVTVSGINLPLNTPFTLDASASDANGDALTYCWEEWDLGTGGAWNNGATNATSPLFKSRIPKISGSRTFPDINVILAGYPANPAATMDGLKGETLPGVARTMRFRVTVRDNRAGGGAVVSAGSGCQITGDLVVNAIGATGPFVVTVPNGGETYPANSSQTVTWNVAGTNAAPISTTNVKISISTDGGFTYPTVLLASTANTGSALVTMPGTITTQAKIKVEAIGNIYFDISNANFTLTAPLTGFNFTPSSPSTVTCPAPSTISVNQGTSSNGGFNTPINLSAISGVPAGTSISFGTNPVIPGASTVVTLNNANTLSNGTYNVTIQGVAGALTQTSVVSFVISAGAAPVITLQPSNATVCAGTSTTFSTTATGATSYQWQLSTDAGITWGDIAGANASTYTVTSPTALQNNYRYRVIVISQCNSVTSAAVILTVNTAPAISLQPQSFTGCAGSNATFTTNATGAGLTYQWQLSTTGCAGPWTNISGATTATLLITGATAVMNGNQYRVIVSGTCTPVATSACATLVVNTPVSITTQPSAATICAGAQTTFSVVASGTTPGYQWQESTDGGASWNNISNAGVYTGATTAALTLTGVSAAMTNYQYRVIVSGAAPCTALNSVPVILTVNTAPTFTTQPAASSTLCAGSNITLTTAASGTAVTYKWQLSTTGATGPWTDIINGGVYSNATTASLTITGVTAAMNSYQYRAVATGTCAPVVNSNAAAITVNTPITITTQPAVNTNICATGSVSFTTAASGTSPTYQWQVSTDAGVSWNNVTNAGVYSGATTPTLTISGITAAMNGYRYRTVISGAAPCGAVNSNSAVLNVTPQPVISASSTALQAGEQAVLTVNVTPAPGLTFAWYLNGVLQSSTGNSIIATVNSLGSYRVIVSSATGSCQSELVTITATPSANLFIFPSPNDGRFTVTYFTAGASVASPSKQSIVIYDAYGRRVHNQEYEVRQEYQLHPIDMRRNGKGVYFIVLREKNGNKIKTGRVIIK